MNEPARPLPTAAYVWKALWPLRWPLSKALWLVSLLAQGLQHVFFGIHVAIDYARLLYLDYDPRPDDIFIDTYPRSGTTWLQMILYQLTTGGNLEELHHISEKCPWFERAALNKRNLEKLPSPRIFKSHLPRIWFPRRAPRVIYVARNGKDVAISFYHFHKSHFKYKRSLSHFFRMYMRGWVVWGSWFYHVSTWWRQRDNPRVLFLKFEDMRADLEGSIRKIIDFCKLEVPEERMPEILHRCSFEYMKEHQQKFDFASEWMYEHGVTHGAFIRQGEVGQWRDSLREEELRRFERKFERKLGRRGLRFDESAPTRTAAQSSTSDDGQAASMAAEENLPNARRTEATRPDAE